MAQAEKTARKRKTAAVGNAQTGLTPHTAGGGPEEREMRIRHRAFDLFEQRIRNGVPGSPDLDWMQAEQEVDGARVAETGKPESDRTTRTET